MEIINAKIINAKIKNEDGNGFLLTLTLDNGKCQMEESWNMQYLSNVMDIIEIADFDKIKGSACRLKIEDRCCRGIGNFIKDEWFDSDDLPFF